MLAEGVRWVLMNAPDTMGSVTGEYVLLGTNGGIPLPGQKKRLQHHLPGNSPVISWTINTGRQVNDFSFIRFLPAFTYPPTGNTRNN